MLRASPLGLLVFAGLLAPAAAGAQQFAIDLHANSGKATQTAHADRAALGVKPAPRGLLELKPGDRITVRWSLRYDQGKPLKDVLIHFFVVREEKVGQPEVPRLDRDVVAESALTMDFDPRDRTEGELTFSLPKAGAYLLRLETIGAAAGPDGQESFAALDLNAR